MNKLACNNQLLFLLCAIAMLGALAFLIKDSQEIILDIRNALPAQQPYTKSADPEWIAVLSQVDPDYANGNNWIGVATELEVLDASQVPDETAPDTPFYLCGNPEDISSGPQTFGTQDKIGVEHALFNAHPDRMNDFEYIRDRKTAREQFLQNLGYQFRLPGRHWHVHVSKAMAVNGEVRLDVWSYSGMDRDDGTSDFDGYLVNEIWKLESSGNPPTLLERSHWTKLGDQCKTLAELGLQPNSPELGAPWDANLTEGINGN